MDFIGIQNVIVQEGIEREGWIYFQRKHGGKWHIGFLPNSGRVCW